MVSHPAMVVGEVVPEDVSCDSDRKGQENGNRGADRMRNEWLENLAVALRKHFKGGGAHEVKRCENRKARRDAEKKALNWVVSKRAEIESAEKIA